jgi:hypothetical protein
MSVRRCNRSGQVMLCYVSSTNIVPKSDNGALIRDRSKVPLCVAASGIDSASYRIEVFISSVILLILLIINTSTKKCTY